MILLWETIITEKQGNGRFVRWRCKCSFGTFHKFTMLVIQVVNFQAERTLGYDIHRRCAQLSEREYVFRRDKLFDKCCQVIIDTLSDLFCRYFLPSNEVWSKVGLCIPSSALSTAIESNITG